MKEYIGKCSECKKSIYCLDGFLNGIISGDSLICFECNEEKETANDDT